MEHFQLIGHQLYFEAIIFMHNTQNIFPQINSFFLYILQIVWERGVHIGQSGVVTSGTTATSATATVEPLVVTLVVEPLPLQLGQRSSSLTKLTSPSCLHFLWVDFSLGGLSVLFFNLCQ